MMYTYQDLIDVGEAEKDKINFVYTAINNHKNSDEYLTALTANDYVEQKNTTIVSYQKLLYTMSGKAVPDNFSANYKMASGFFKQFTTQQTQFLLGNGVSWTKEDTNNKLSNNKYNFNSQLKKIGKSSLIEGVAFGYWNKDHLEMFRLTEFVPLYDEENGSLRAGIRFWQINNSKPLRATLYEEDGYIEIIWRKGKDYEILQQKTSYIVNYRKEVGADDNDIEIYDYSNYPTFPIVPLWGNPEHQSEIVGIREQIDCYDLIKSGFANDLDDASQIYWTISNAGGMDDVDLAQFIQRLKTVHAATVNSDGATAEAHTVEVPYQSREQLLDRLRNDLYKDYMAFDTDSIANGAVTATQIKASYEPMNNKADEWESCVNDFVNNILTLAGVEDTPTFTRSMIINTTENIQTLLQAAQYLSEDYVTKKIMEYLDDGDKAEDVIKAKEDEQYEIYNDEEEQVNEGQRS